MPIHRFITLAIHTYPHAVHLKKVLESHGIEARIEKINDAMVSVEVGVRVKISSKDLPLALRIVESDDGFAASGLERKVAGLSSNVLIPVDFSEYCEIAVTLGFALAERLGLSVTLLHTFATPYFADAISPMNIGGTDDPTEVEIQNAETESVVSRDAKKAMNSFIDKIKAKIAAGELPDVRFSSIVEEGLPEEVILEYSRESKPSVIVMATRGKSRKAEELIGSVTAEVLDSCRVPVFAVPEHYVFTSIPDIKKLAFFCTLTQNDLLSIDTLMRMFSYPEVDITLVPATDRQVRDMEGRLASLQKYLTENYPASTFHTHLLPQGKEFRGEMESFIQNEKIELLVVPNKKTNIFSRLFNPGIAHRILFERDIPLFALPI